MTGDDLLLPLRSNGALRDEVAGRVARRRRQRARRRVVGMGLPAIVAGLLFVVGFDRVPGVPVDVDTVRPADAPTTEGSVATEPGDTSARVEARGGRTGIDAQSSSSKRAAGPGQGSPSAWSPESEMSASPSSPSAPRAPGAAPTENRHMRLVVARSDGIWELHADGTPVRRLADAGREPAWSPDGRRLAYTKRWEGVGGGEGIAVLELDTMESRLVLMASDADYIAPAWSPDGTRVAASRIDRTLSAPPDLQPSIVVVDATDGTGRLDFGPGERPSWLVDGRILYRCGNRLCIRSTDGRMAEVPQSPEVFGGEWSPAGDWIAAWEQGSHALVLVRPDGTERRAVVGRITGMPAWSPDGSRLVYPSDDGLRSVRLDGGDVRRLTDQPSDTDPHLLGLGP